MFSLEIDNSDLELIHKSRNAAPERTGLFCWNCGTPMLHDSLACGCCGLRTVPEFDPRRPIATKSIP